MLGNGVDEVHDAMLMPGLMGTWIARTLHGTHLICVRNAAARPPIENVRLLGQCGRDALERGSLSSLLMPALFEHVLDRLGASAGNGHDPVSVRRRTGAGRHGPGPGRIP